MEDFSENSLSLETRTNFCTKLLRETIEGNVDWRRSTSGFQDEIRYDMPLYASIGDFRLRINSHGRLEITKDRVVYEFGLKSKGKKIYEAARETASLDLPDPEDVIESLRKEL